MGKEGGKEGRHPFEENTRWMLAISLKGTSLMTSSVLHYNRRSYCIQ